jgi:hypothetical protein
MNTQMMKRAVVLFPRTTYTDAHAVRHARRQWLLAVALLGEKWILAKPIERLH